LRSKGGGYRQLLPLQLKHHLLAQASVQEYTLVVTMTDEVEDIRSGKLNLNQELEPRT